MSDVSNDFYDNFYLQTYNWNQYCPTKIPNEYYDFVESNPRGHGLWAWKSLILSKAVNGYFGSFDGVFYSDAGTELLINYTSKKKLIDLMENAEKIGIVTFSTNAIEKHFSKKLALDLLADQAEKYSVQREATSIFVSTNDNSARNIVDKWQKLCFQDNFALLLDPVQRFEKHPFIDHRHDQSVLSILLKNARIPSLEPVNPRSPGNTNSFLERLIFTPWPLWQIRNRSGSTLLSNWQNISVISILCVPFFNYRIHIFKGRRFFYKIRYWVLKQSSKLRNTS